MEKNIAERIKELREQQGISTNKLSTLAGLSQSYVRKIEQGETNPSVASIELICKALKIDIIDFFSSEEITLNQLRAFKIIRGMSEAQVEGFCKMMSVSFAD